MPHTRTKRENIDTNNKNYLATIKYLGQAQKYITSIPQLRLLVPFLKFFNCFLDIILDIIRYILGANRHGSYKKPILKRGFKLLFGKGLS